MTISCKLSWAECLCSFRWWSVRWGNKRAQRRDARKKSLFTYRSYTERLHCTPWRAMWEECQGSQLNQAGGEPRESEDPWTSTFLLWSRWNTRKDVGDFIGAFECTRPQSGEGRKGNCGRGRHFHTGAPGHLGKVFAISLQGCWIRKEKGGKHEILKIYMVSYICLKWPQKADLWPTGKNYIANESNIQKCAKWKRPPQKAVNLIIGVIQAETRWSPVGKLLQRFMQPMGYR